MLFGLLVITFALLDVSEIVVSGRRLYRQIPSSLWAASGNSEVFSPPEIFVSIEGYEYLVDTT